jgi:DNA (cytosine-5)-methyltransferase 1
MVIESNELKFVGGIQTGKMWIDDGKDLSRNYRSGNRVYDAEGIAVSQTAEGGGLAGCTGLYKVEEEIPNPELIGGIGEKNFGKQYRQGNRVYDADKTAMCLLSQPVGNAGGNSYLYKVEDKQAIDNISDQYQFTKDKCQEYYDKHGYLPDMFNPYNQTEITDAAPTLTTGCNRVSNSSQILLKDRQYRIRKLTEVECYKLMGFDKEDALKVKSAGISNSQLYKQAGNSIVVTVLDGIFKNLFPQYIKQYDKTEFLSCGNNF